LKHEDLSLASSGYILLEKRVLVVLAKVFKRLRNKDYVRCEVLTEVISLVYIILDMISFSFECFLKLET